MPTIATGEAMDIHNLYTTGAGVYITSGIYIIHTQQQQRHNVRGGWTRSLPTSASKKCSSHVAAAHPHNPADLSATRYIHGLLKQKERKKVHIYKHKVSHMVYAPFVPKPYASI